MEYTTLSDYVSQGLSSHQIAKAANKSQTTIRYWLKKHNLKTQISLYASLSNCEKCGRQLRGKQKKFCSKKCKNKTNNNIHQVYAAQKQRGLKRKLELIKILGGECVKCGYSKNIAALEFHHTDPDIKEYNLDMRRLSNASLERIHDEVKKCQLLCANCHREYHHPTCDINLIEKW